MKTQTRSTTTFPALRRLSAGVLLCCAMTVQAAPAAEQAALNFVGADIEAVIKAVGHYTGQTFIIDPRVKGTLTLVSETPATKAQAFQLLASALRLQGYAIVAGEGFAKVVPEADAKLQSGPVQVGSQAALKGDQVATQVFHLQYESAVNLAGVIKPLISPNNTVNANPGNNTLVVTDYADNLKRIAKIVASLDAPANGDIDVVPVQYAVASDIVTLVNKLMEGGAQGGDAAARTAVLADPRTNSLLIRAATPARAAQAKSLIAKLDLPTARAGNVHVVPLKNADAVQLAATLRAVISGEGSLPTRQSGTQGGSVTAGSTSGSGGASSVSNQQQQANNQQGNLTQQASQLAGGGGASGAGYIQADAATNTLIITASEAVYRNLRAVIDQLDTRRAQVYIEALVVEVSSNKASEFGVQWLGLSGDGNSNYRVGTLQNFAGGSTPSGTSNSLTALATGKGAVLPGPGMSIGVFRQINGQLGLGALAHLLETDANANILSTPHALTVDNELASIKVGKNVPIISGQFTTAAGGANANPFQTIDRRDVGLILKVRPQISEGGTIKLAIYNESSSVDPASLNASSGVTINNRVIENNVIAEDGQIIVLGGLIEDSEGDGVEKVSGLGDLPIIGNLFKYQTRARKKTNLMVFLRPLIVRTPNQSENLALDRYDYMRAEGQRALPADSALVRDLGAPVLPQLNKGQPPAGGQMATRPVPAQPEAKQP
ncbi:type II secretion system secretin GspD [Massilia sp. TS11]|nr:type II secretion system secretin GspD [Massilia sp. TS11]